MSAEYSIAIDLGGTNLKIALIDARYRILVKEIVSTSSYQTKTGLIRRIEFLVNDIIDKRNLSKSQVLGVGIGVPGPVDCQKGIVHFFPNIPGWKDVHLKTLLNKKLRLPVFLDNDANLMALGEFTLGAARSFKHAVCITLGTGVGGGIILNGKLFRGRSNATGEIGHIPINEDGIPCNCGGRGCLEAYIGNKKISQEAKRIFKRRISLEELSFLAKAGNKSAIAIWGKVGERLGVALVAVVNLLNPDGIVIGGGVANAGRVLFNKVKQVIAQRAMPVQARDVIIVKATLGENAGLIGAAVFVRGGFKA